MKITMIFVASCFSLIAYSRCQAQTAADFVWMEERFPSVFEELMPMDEGVGRTLGFRSYRDYYTDVLEYSCAFSEEFEGPKKIGIIATLRIPESVSLYDQMIALHSKNRTESVESIKSKLKIRDWRLTDRTCPAVKELYSEFYKLTLPMLSTEDKTEQVNGVGYITLHPMVYDIQASISGGSMKLSLSQEDHVFVLWAKKTRTALDACIQSNKRNGK